MPEGADAVFVCVQDQMHRPCLEALAPLNLHVMCEKPLASNLDDCVAIYKSLLPDPQGGALQAVLHRPRAPVQPAQHAPAEKLLLEDKVIGEIMAVNHTEPVGWYHFTHSYVR